MSTPAGSCVRQIELITDRPVERFLLRLFLRDTDLRGLCLVSPFISSLAQSRFTLADLRNKVERERVPTYVVTRAPTEDYQKEAMTVLLGSPWIEIRYNACLHAKVYVALSSRDADSFGLFGSGNLTAKSFESNIEVAMMLYSEGIGRKLMHELHYWASGNLRTLRETVLVQRITRERR
jgi:phosphatidylserine/phosphatidylglycerophosphate/cardiolipin synthase-like enzyme